MCWDLQKNWIINICCNDVKTKSWSLIKRIIDKNKWPQVQTKFKLPNGNWNSDSKFIAEKFNEIFINIGLTLSEGIPDINMSPLHHMGDKLEIFVFLSLWIYITRSNKNHNGTEKSASGFDDIDATLLKSVVPYIAQPLYCVWNLSLSEGIFPVQLKIANVLPLYKAADSVVFDNHWLVSMLVLYRRSL